MTSATLYMLAAVALFALGLFAVLTVPHLLRKILALNVIGAGVFMLLVAIAHPTRTGDPSAPADPVPHALVLTGIVVAVSATAVGLVLAAKYYEATGRSELPEDHREGRSPR